MSDTIQHPATAPAAPETSAAMEMLRVALPAIVTMLSYTAMQFVDMYIVSYLGSEALSAVGNGGVAAFVPGAALFGVTGVVSTFVSQHFGAGRPERGSAYAWNGLWLTVIFWLLLLLPFAAVLPHAMSLMRSALGLEVPATLLEMEAQYGRILLVGLVFTVAAREMSQFYYGIHRARAVMIAALVGNVINIPITWALVMGDWGFPQLGVGGAAIGTVIAGLCEFLILFGLFVSPKYNELFKTRSAWRPHAKQMRDIWKLGWPAGVMHGNELMCWALFMAGLVAHFGVAHNTASWITLRYMHISFMPAFGMSMAITAVVGKCIGMGRHDLAAKRAWLGVRMCAVYMGLCALAFVLFRHEMVSFFSQKETDAALRAEIIAIGGSLLVIAAAFQFFDGMAISLVGALRGAGDTVWPGIVTAILSWMMIIGVGFSLKALFPGLGSVGPWLGAAAYIISLCAAMLIRWQRGPWRSIDLLGKEQAGLPEGMLHPGVALDAGEGIAPQVPGADGAEEEMRAELEADRTPV